MDTRLHVITVVSNPIRYKSRYRLYHDFAKRVKDAGAILHTVELAFGERDFLLTQPNDPLDVQVRTWHELWHKENLINIGLDNLPPDWKYVAWIDADIQFTRPDWAVETVHLLQHNMFVQMFSHSQDLGPHLEPLGQHNGFVYSWLKGKAFKKGYENWHPGYAWAARREAIEAVGGLIDLAILGSGDRHMATAMIGQVHTSFNNKVHRNYKDMCFQWQARCDKWIMQDVGYLSGLLLHHWHGKKKDRHYVDRWKILVESNYNPFLDVRKDCDGVLVLTDRNLKLRDGIRKYFRSRNEDSIDLE